MLRVDDVYDVDTDRLFTNDESNVDQTDPAELLEETLDTGLVMTGTRTPGQQAVRASRNLARLLLDQNPIALAKTIEHFAEYGGAPPNVSNAMISLLRQKIFDCTPDQLNAVVQQAKAEGLWEYVKVYVNERNDMLAEQMEEYTNAAALENFMLSVEVTETGWIPAPIYQRGIKMLRQMATVATLSKLDLIVQIATKRNMKFRVMPSVKDRNSALIETIVAFRKPWGYGMRRGHEQKLVQNPMAALRMRDSGYEFIGDK